GDGGQTRPPVDARRAGGPGRPPRARRQHQEPDQGRRAVRAAARPEPRDELREGLDPDPRVVRGRHDPARRPRPVPQSERPANRPRGNDRGHRAGLEPVCRRDHVSRLQKRERPRTRESCDRPGHQWPGRSRASVPDHLRPVHDPGAEREALRPQARVRGGWQQRLQLAPPRPREVGHNGHALPARASGPRNHGRRHRRSAIDRHRPGGQPTPCAEGDPRPIPRESLRASREPVNRVRPLRTIVRGLRRWLRLVAVVLILAGIVAAIAFPEAAWNAIQLPLFAFSSTTRMVVAYLFALVFAIAYGHTAATNKRASAALLPLLDVLQSIPILGFFPAALIFFVATFRGPPIGIEFAVVFLIFTSMACNMAFSASVSLTTIPADLEAAAASFGLRGWLRFRYLAFPAAIPKLVYNSILSWTNGWFFLVASEIFSAGGTEFQRPGLGAFIAVAGRNGD